ncbi:MAG TPA: tetratricopeptide repeat protein [Bacteroidales bacterium]|nr:tetratricopeptide repeat protein [Bacteroidales bacterium]
MKRLLSIVLIFCGIGAVAMAQDNVVLLNYNSLQKKLEKSNEKIQNEKKSSKAKTWFDRGKLMQDIFDIDLEYVTDGMEPSMLKLYYKDPENVTTETKDGEKIQTFQYERMDYVFKNNKLDHWVRKEIVTETPLDKAYKAYEQTLKLDEKGKYTDKVKDQLLLLKKEYQQKGINAYYSGNSKKALQSFETILNIDDMKMFEGAKDTLMIQSAGIIARELGEYQTAIKYYKKLADLGFGGPNTYLNIKSDYLSMGDTTQAIKTMENAFAAYPDTLSVIANLVDLYIRTGEIDQGLKTVDNAIGSNPDRAELYYWKGRLLLNSKADSSIEKAIKAYHKSLERDPNLYYVYYDLGLIYFLQGQDIFKQAGMEKDVDKRKQVNDIATKKYEDAIPMLQKALNLNEGNAELKKETLDLLKRIYYKLQMEDKYNDIVNQINNLK